MVTQTPQQDDPAAAAMAAEYVERPRTYFGQITADYYFCALVKGEGKVLFDPLKHPKDQRFTAINLVLTPLAGSPIKNNIERQMIAESKAWASFVKPSLLAVGADLRTINGRWAQVQMVPTGRKYEAEDQQTKEKVTREETTFKFIALYPDESSCRAASDALFSRTESTSAPATPPSTASTPGNGNNPERTVAAKFLPALWAQSGKDVVRFQEAIAKNSLTAKWFDISSPEVVAVISA
jgi:hypothetical protein